MADNVTDVFGSWLPALAAQQGQQGTTGAKQPRENSSADGLPSKTRGRIEPHQAGDIPHTAPSTTRARSRAQGAVQRRHRVASQEEQRKASPGLTLVLFGVLLAETQARMQLFSKDDAAVKAAQTNHVLDKDKRFVYQKWDAQASKLVTDPDKKGLTLEEVMAILTELRKLSNDQAVGG